jgi:hypothetical protein
MSKRMSTVAIILLSAIAAFFPLIRRRRMRRTMWFSNKGWSRLLRWGKRFNAGRMLRLIT